MSLVLDDGDVRLYHGDALTVLQSLPAESVHMCVTSPPFYGLRDYGTGRWEGGDPDCDHTQTRRRFADGCIGCGIVMSEYTAGCRLCDARQRMRRKRGNPDKDYLTPADLPDPPGNWEEGRTTKEATLECGKCGARRVDQQIGLEETPEQWVDSLVAVFREARRVLRPEGTLWLEVGDSYGANQGKAYGTEKAITGTGKGGGRADDPDTPRPTAWGGNSATPQPHPYKPKDLIGAPWALAFALRADGWYLRSDIVWARPNPMPESVTDRPTKSHSYVFLLSKQPRYFFDQEAVREPAEFGRSSLTFKNGDLTRGHGAGGANDCDPTHGRNVRSVWNIATQPYPEAHFATFPEELAKRCILAGTSERGCCPECGAPWVRTTDQRQKPPPLGEWLRDRRLAVGLSAKELCGVIGAHGRVNHGGAVSNWEADNNIPTAEQWQALKTALGFGNEKDALLLAWHEWEHGEWGTTPNPFTHGAPSAGPASKAKAPTTLGWHPSCDCACETDAALAPVSPAVVLDPFVGSGTVPYVARKHGRHAIGIDLSHSYLELASRRLQQLSLFA